MFKSKYMFETKETRYLRYLKSLLILLFSLFSIYIILCFVFILISIKLSNETTEALYKRPPDSIVVFTGDAGRIPYALKKAIELKQSNVFITGVYSKNTVKTLLKPLEIKEGIDSNLLEIDYLAKNTFENVLSTFRYLRKNKSFNRILVISHDYHIIRIKIIINKVKNNNEKYHFFYTGIKTDYTQWRNIKKLVKEMYKLIRTCGFLFLWNNEAETSYLKLNPSNSNDFF